jgi:hypothetical protein
MGKLDGTSDWCEIMLPFHSKPGMLPKKIWVNVVLPGAGTVMLEPFRMSPVFSEKTQAIAPDSPPGLLPDWTPPKKRSDGKRP